MLPARRPPARRADHRTERTQKLIQNGNEGNVHPSRRLFEQVPQRFVEDGADDDPGLATDPVDDPLHLFLSTHQNPEMLGELDIVELHEAGARDASRRVAGSIGNEVQVDLLHSPRRRKPVRRLWTVYRLSRPSISPPDRSDRMPCRPAQRRSGSGTAVMEYGGSLPIPRSPASRSAE